MAGQHTVHDPKESGQNGGSLAAVVGDLGRHVAELATVFDDAGTLLWVNDRVQPLLGRTPWEWVGRPAVELCHPDDIPLGLELLVSAQATGPGVKEPVVYRLAHADGSWVPFECIATVVPTSDGDGRLLVVTARPVGAARPIDNIFDEASARVALMFDSAAVGMAQVALDGVILRANATLAQMVGVADGRPHGRFDELVHPADRDGFHADVTEHLVEGPRRGAARLVRVDDRGEVPVEITGSLIRDHLGAPLYHAYQVMDVTPLVEAQEALRRSERQMASILELAHEGIAVLDADGRVEFANPRMAELIGDAPSAIRGSTLDALLGRVRPLRPRDDDARREIERLEVELPRDGGSPRWAVVTTSPFRWADQAPGRLVMATDITDFKDAENSLRQRSTHDHLTGLANRMLLEAWVPRSNSALVAALFVDLDGFKEVNDSLGHSAGDEVLVAVATRLEQAVRDDDLVVRYGGDEFVVVCEGMAEHDASRFGARLVEALSEPVATGAGRAQVGASVGVACGAVTEIDAVILDADKALYAAKRLGRNQVAVFPNQSTDHR